VGLGFKVLIIIPYGNVQTSKNTQQHPHEHCSKGKQKWVSREMISFASTYALSLSLSLKEKPSNLGFLHSRCFMNQH
jgi:hypothetical protein